MAQISTIATAAPATRSHLRSDGVSGWEPPSVSKSAASIGDFTICLQGT
jgi:hypothetical protein